MSGSVNAVVSAVELAPTIISSLQAVSADVSSDEAAHKSVIATATDVAETAIPSLNAIAASGAVGHNDAANIETGVAVVETAGGLAEELAALIARIRAWL
jgi:hypothetical protein